MIALKIDLREDRPDCGMCVFVCGFVPIACVRILQHVSRVAHLNDCVEDRSKRRLS